MKSIYGLVAAAAISFATPVLADPIAPGGTVSYTVPGTASIYQIFGHPGNPGGDYGPASDALLTTFAAGSGNAFTVTAAGLVSCCSNAPNIPPDGGSGGMSVGGANGLSSLSGNTLIPLVGVFTTETDPFGGTPPAALAFDASNPLSLSPLLNQVFYIGDGRSGFNNSLGALLTFTAPTNATRFYVAGIDAFGFNGLTGYYNDNQGSWDVTINLAAVPEPSTWAIMLLGFGAAGGAMRARRRVRAFAMV